MNNLFKNSSNSNISNMIMKKIQRWKSYLRPVVNWVVDINKDTSVFQLKGEERKETQNLYFLLFIRK